MAVASEISLQKLTSAEEIKKNQEKKVNKNLSIPGYASELSCIFLLSPVTKDRNTVQQTGKRCQN